MIAVGSMRLVTCRLGRMLGLCRGWVRSGLRGRRSRERTEHADEDEVLWRSAAMLGPEWRFGREDMPHFAHDDGRRWLVLDEIGRWEAWLGHRPVGRFATLRDAKGALRRIVGR
jgi:hypothetical protein